MNKMPEKRTRYKFQYCTLWNKEIPGVVLRDPESNNPSDMWFDLKSKINPVQEYWMGGSFLCNTEVNNSDMERAINGIEALLKLQSKYDGALNIPVTIPFSEYIHARSKSRSAPTKN